jgi:hypothetical protein
MEKLDKLPMEKEVEEPMVKVVEFPNVHVTLLAVDKLPLITTVPRVVVAVAVKLLV